MLETLLYSCLPDGEAYEMEYVDYEAILETNSPGDIALVKSVLEAEEITYFFNDEYSAQYMYYAVPMRLMVRKDQAEKTIEILKDLNLSFAFGGQHNKIEEEND